MLHVPVALFTLVTDEQQVFKSSVGVGELRSTPLSHSFCRHVVDSGAPLEVVDARIHPKVRDNPAIEDYGIVSYLGMPLVLSTGERLGALCAIDHEPRQWTGRDHGVLEDLAGAAMAEVELRRANRAVAAAAAELHFVATHDSLTRLGQPARAARRPRRSCWPTGARRRSRCSTCTGCAASTTPTGTSPATSCWRGWAGGWRSMLVGHGHVYRLGGVQLCALLHDDARDAVAVACRALSRARVGRRLSRRDGRDAARGGEHRRRAAPRGRAAGTLRACCDRWRLTSKNGVLERGWAVARRRSPASTRPAS